MIASDMEAAAAASEELATNTGMVAVDAETVSSNLGGGGSGGGSAGAAIAELQGSLTTLLSRLDPVAGATLSLADDMQMLDEALAAGLITAGEHAAAIERLQFSYRDALDPLAAFARQMEEQTMLLGMDARARQLQVDMLRAQAQLAGQLGRELTEAELGQVEAAIRLNQELEAQAKVLDDIRAPQEDFTHGIEVLTALLDAGQISLAEFTARARDLRIAFLDTQTDTFSGFERGFLKAQVQMEDFASSSEALITDAFSEAQDALVEFFQTGELNMESFFQSLSENFLRLGTQQLFGGLFGSEGGGGFLGDLFGGIFGGGGGAKTKGGGGFFDDIFGSLLGGIGGLIGFADGTENMPVDALAVGSLSGIDNRLVAFRARSDETVSVRRPGDAGSAPPITVNVYAQDAESFRRSEGQILARTQAALERAARRNN
jgi:lambda family phage tail tape measure protein